MSGQHAALQHPGWYFGSHPAYGVASGVVRGEADAAGPADDGPGLHINGKPITIREYQHRYLGRAHCDRVDADEGDIDAYLDTLDEHANDGGDPVGRCCPTHRET